MASKKPVKARNASKQRRSARTSSQEANETDEHTNNAEGDLFREEEDEEEYKEDDEEEEDDGSGDEDSTYLAMLAEVAEAKKKAEALKAKKA